MFYAQILIITVCQNTIDENLENGPSTLSVGATQLCPANSVQLYNAHKRNDNDTLRFAF